MIIDDEGFAVERWASDDSASLSHGIAAAPCRWMYRVVMNTYSNGSSICAGTQHIPNSRPIWLKRSGHVGERAHRDMRDGVVCVMSIIFVV